MIKQRYRYILDSKIHIDSFIKVNRVCKMTWILEQLKKSIHNTTAVGINDFSGEFLSLEDHETHHSVVLDKSISKFDLMINNLLLAIELQGESLPVEEIPEYGNPEDLNIHIMLLTKLNDSIKVLSESRAYLEMLNAEMVHDLGRKASRHLNGTEL